MHKQFILIAINVYLLTNSVTKARIIPAPNEETPSFWIKSAKDDLKTAHQLYTKLYKNTAKNAILFLGDGMGMTSVTAGRILKGQLSGVSGEQTKLVFEKFPHTGLIKTYNTDMQTPDSAGTGTAFMCGVKARSATVGVNQNVDTKNCSTYNSERHDVKSFLDEALEAGKSVGVVTTTRITHATPAAGYAHSVHRDWEDDTDRNKDVADEEGRNKCLDIAQQLVRNSHKFSVFFGGGRKKFLPKSQNGSRSDNRDLTSEWQQKSNRHHYISTRQQLQALNPDNFDSVLGLFADSHLDYDLDNSKKSDSNRQPSISEMAAKAVEILQRNPKGFALLVEGGRIDHGHHDNQAKRALHDLVAFESAIQNVKSATKESETLIIVTADHSHVFSVGGWANRGNPILGKVKYSYYNNYNEDGEALARDKMPYTSLFYGDGPGAPVDGSGRRDLTRVDTQADNFIQSAIVPQSYESHGSEDVPAYASGPGAHLLHSTHEQSYLSNLFKHAMCVGEYEREGNCLRAGVSAAAAASSAVTVAVATVACVISGRV